MTDKEFEQLKMAIEITMNKLDNLQKLYSNETGRDFVRPLRLSPLREKGVDNPFLT